MFDDLGYLMLSFITTTLDYNPNKLRVNPLNLATITFLATEPDHSGTPGAAGVLPCFSAVLFLRLWYFTPSMTMDEIYSFGYVQEFANRTYKRGFDRLWFRRTTYESCWIEIVRFTKGQASLTALLSPFEP
jgi:hypothetical protein